MSTGNHRRNHPPAHDHSPAATMLPPTADQATNPAETIDNTPVATSHGAAASSRRSGCPFSTTPSATRAQPPTATQGNGESERFDTGLIGPYPHRSGRGPDAPSAS